MDRPDRGVRLDKHTGGGNAAPCETAGKHKYLTRAAAAEAKKRVKKRDGVKVYVYQCESCSCWHLTHRAPR